MTKDTYSDLNAEVKLLDEEGKPQLHKDKDSVRAYFLEHVNQSMVFFHSLEEKVEHLTGEVQLWDKDVVLRYGFDGLKRLMKQAYGHKFRFKTYMGALKFYNSYALKTNDGKRYYERYEDRVVLTAIHYSEDFDHAEALVDLIIKGIFQPATPTFLNAGLLDAGKPVSCFILDTQDNMESIGRIVQDSLQLSKRGGGVGIGFSNLREAGAPIKGREGQASGVIPVMKLLEDSFSYANQLGARQGAGAVYLNAHHPDILAFLDTKRENADEKIRIKTLSLGVIVPDVTFRLAKDNEPMALFSPYDINKVYGKSLSEFSVTEMYDTWLEDDRIAKTFIDARKLFQTIAEVQFESGYPYLMFDDAANRGNPAPNIGRIKSSNLCVTGDTQILTSRGYRRADVLWETQEDFEVVVDERARTMDLKSTGTSVQKSSKMFKTATDADVYKVTTAEGHEIKATEWHKFYVDRDGELVKIPLAELEVGDHLLAHRTDFSTVASIEFYGVEDVYDPTVENGHSVIYNGLVTGNCSEIFQPSSPSEFSEDSAFTNTGRDISCNLGSLNVARLSALDPDDFHRAVRSAYKFLNQVAVQTEIGSSPTVVRGNRESRAIGLGQMNLHGALIELGLDYDSQEARDWFEWYMMRVTFSVISASVDKAEEMGSGFKGAEGSKWGEIISGHRYRAVALIDRLATSGNATFTEDESADVAWGYEWLRLRERFDLHGIYNQNLQAIPPTGSISYINHATASIHPVTSPVEVRKEGKLGRVYYPQYGVTNENVESIDSAYAIGPNPIIDMYAVASPWVDQGMSLTLFFPDTATTRDINRAQIYAHKKGLKSLYYIRTSAKSVEGTEVEGCLSCAL